MIRALVTGARGQVGGEVVRALEGRAEVLARDRASLDFTRPDEVRDAVRESRPRLIVNCAAYTAVDRAEADLATARTVNAEAVGVLAREAKRCDALLIHFSTDYVFDGAKREPYVEGDAPHPVNVYGLTKLEGEQAIGASGCAAVVLRTSWVYGPHGNNFLHTMLRLAGEREELAVVDEQRGAPTTSLQLAHALAAILGGGDASRPIAQADVERLAAARGLYHASAGGETTWFGFAQAIFAGWSRRHPEFRAPRLVAIPASEYPAAAARPVNSVLSNARLAAAFGVQLTTWQQGLEETLDAL